MKILFFVFIYINIWKLIFSAIPDKVAQTTIQQSNNHHDKSYLLTLIGRKKELVKCKVETEFILTAQAFCGSCNDPDVQDGFQKMLKCRNKTRPDIAKYFKNAKKEPLNACTKKLIDHGVEKTINDPAKFKNGLDCFTRHVSKEGLAKCSVHQFYKAPATILCCGCNDSNVEEDMKSLTNCLLKEVPPIAEHLLKLIKNVTGDICINNVLDYATKILLADNDAFYKAQVCYKKIVRLDLLHKCYIEQKYGLTIKIFCGGCHNPHIKNTLACQIKKIPDAVEFLENASKNGPERCLNQVKDYLTDLAMNNPAAFQLGEQCFTENVDNEN